MVTCRRGLVLLCCVLLGLGGAPAGHGVLFAETNGAALSPGVEPSALLIEPGSGIKSLTRAMNRAQSHIFAEVYILTDARIVHALERAETEKVDVRVLLDRQPYGMGTQPERMAAQLRAAGIAVRWAPAGFTFTHAKFLVLDDSTAIVATANFSRSAFSINREFLVFLKGRTEVRTISNVFRRDWDRLPVRTDDSNLLVAPLDARGKLTALVRSARHSLDLYAEEFADPAFEALLTGLARRKIRVRILLPGGITPQSLRALTQSGVQVRQLSVPYGHAKALIVDCTHGFVGSENVSTTSLDRNREVGVLIRGPDVTAIKRTFNLDWKASASFPGS